MITGPASAQSASGFYLSQELGLNLAAPVDLLGNSNDRASHCDEFINPRFAEIPGCTDPDRGSGAGWKTAYDGATGILAGLSAGYRFSRRLRVEAEWFHRESEYDQTSPVASATGATFAKLDGEIQRAEDRIGSISSQNVFANVHVDLLTALPWKSKTQKDLAGAGWGRCRMHRPALCMASSPITWSLAPASSLTAGRATTESNNSATSTTGTASGPRGLEGRIPTSCSRRSTGSPPWSSAGSWAPTKAQWATRTYPDT